MDTMEIIMWAQATIHFFLVMTRGFPNGDEHGIRYPNFRKTSSDWWFGTMEFYDFPYIGNSNPN